MTKSFSVSPWLSVDHSELIVWKDAWNSQSAKGTFACFGWCAWVEGEKYLWSPCLLLLWRSQRPVSVMWRRRRWLPLTTESYAQTSADTGEQTMVQTMSSNAPLRSRFTLSQAHKLSGSWQEMWGLESFVGRTRYARVSDPRAGQRVVMRLD